MRPDLPPPMTEALRLPPAIVTGEAVLLEVRPASPMSRALALCLDAAVILTLAVALLVVAGLAVADADSDAVSAVGLLCLVALFVGVPTAWETLSRGRSPGKAAAGLRVVRDDGGPVRSRQALVRALVGVGEIWLLAGAPAFLTMLASAQGKRIGDLLAGTIVVRERGGPRSAPPVVCPPELAGWVRSADIGRLPDDVAVAGRAVLARGQRLNPASRARLLADLARRVLPLVAPPPPPGTAPERLLAAVLAERRERDRVRMLAARGRRDALAEQARLLVASPHPVDPPQP